MTSYLLPLYLSSSALLIRAASWQLEYHGLPEELGGVELEASVWHSASASQNSFLGGILVHPLLFWTAVTTSLPLSAGPGEGPKVLRPAPRRLVPPQEHQPALKSDWTRARPVYFKAQPPLLPVMPLRFGTCLFTMG